MGAVSRGQKIRRYFVFAAEKAAKQAHCASRRRKTKADFVFVARRRAGRQGARQDEKKTPVSRGLKKERYFVFAAEKATT